MRADFHLHTGFSADTDTLPEAMVERAIELGLKTICITDHQDYDFPKEGGIFEVEREPYFAKMRELQERYRDKIELLIGIELGMQPHIGTENDAYVKDYPFDFVLGAVHAVARTDLYYKEIFEDKTDSEAYRLVLEETLADVTCHTDYDVLAHIDYAVRYGKHQEAEYSYRQYADLIDEILKHLIENGKGLELNTAGWKYGLPFAHPHPDVLARYKELGGEIITIGSDGHRPEHLAYDFHRVSDILKAHGFKYYTEFRQRKPYFCALP